MHLHIEYDLNLKVDIDVQSTEILKNAIAATLHFFFCFFKVNLHYH